MTGSRGGIGRWIRGAGALLVFCVVCVAGLEVLLRALAPVRLNSPRFRTSERSCTELIASSDGVLQTTDFRHAFHVDERGDRSSARRGSPERTVAVVGDSMVFGEGVEDHE